MFDVTFASGSMAGDLVASNEITIVDDDVSRYRIN